MPTHTVHYVLSTHWDREWYQSFQDYRWRLVQLIDRLLEGWQSGTLRGPFQTDGQAILLEDYLEVRPEKTALVRRLVQEGKFVVGPWYTLPDEFIPSGEALIRNLELGRRLARQWGGVPSNAGFLCDMFGHNSQMPQIFKGFGIPMGFIWRGTNLAGTALLRWRGADGSELPCYRFGCNGYCDYMIGVRGGEYGQVCAGQYSTNLEAWLQKEAARTEIGPLLAFDGGDHQEWDPPSYAVLLERIQKGGKDFRIVHSSLEEYMAGLLPYAGQIHTLLEGELRQTATQPPEIDNQGVPQGCISSRVWLKQRNAACQARLCQWAEPFSALGRAALGLPDVQGFLDVAWKGLLANHAHDSICGCSIDAVHKDMQYRFDQSQQIASRVTLESTRQLAASVAGVPAENELRVVVFNPLARPLFQPFELDLELPADWPGFTEHWGFERRPAFRIYDSQGHELPYQRLGQAGNQVRFRLFDQYFPRTYQVNVVRVSLPLELPPLGYTTLTVRPVEAGAVNPASIAGVTRCPPAPGLVCSQAHLENEILSVQVEPNGTLTLTDKRSGRVYPRLLTFEDRADIGDGWNFSPAANDQVFFSTCGSASVAQIYQGPYLAALRIRVTLELPEQFDGSSGRRSEKLGNLVVESLVSLRRGADWVEVESMVHNTIQDHRLRVLFPSAASAATYLSDSPFDVVERPIALPADNHLYREMEQETKPQQTWTAVFDQDGGLPRPWRGLALVSSGLYECAVQDLPERPLALTLLRSTRRTVFTDGEPGGQGLGDQRFRYWIVPLVGEPERARLCEMGQALEAGLCVVQQTALDVKLHKQGRSLPPQAGWLALEGPVVLTSLRRASPLVGEAHNRVEVRLFNPNTRPVRATLDWSGRPDGENLPTRAVRVDFEGHPLGEALGMVNGRVELAFKPKEIVTVRFE